MAGAEKRLPVFPSRMVLQGIKERASAARKGWDLLKRKSDAIKMSLNSKLKEILAVKRRVGESMRQSAFKHTEAIWAAGPINNAVIEGTREASFRVATSLTNVAGVKLPNFERIKDESNQGTLVGLSRGNEQVVKAKESFVATLEDLVKLASLQTSVKTLDDALKVTNRRVNALEFVILPQLYNTIKYINSELDELEREDNYRIKKVKDLWAAASELDLSLEDQAEMSLEEQQELRRELVRLREEEARKADEAPSALGDEDLDITDSMLA